MVPVYDCCPSTVVNDLLFYSQTYLGLYDKVHGHRTNGSYTLVLLYLLANKWLVKTNVCVLPKTKRLTRYYIEHTHTEFISGRQMSLIEIRAPLTGTDFTFMPLKDNSNCFLGTTDSPLHRNIHTSQSCKTVCISNFEMPFLSRFFSF